MIKRTVAAESYPLNNLDIFRIIMETRIHPAHVINEISRLTEMLVGMNPRDTRVQAALMQLRKTPGYQFLLPPEEWVMFSVVVYDRKYTIASAKEWAGLFQKEDINRKIYSHYARDLRQKGIPTFVNSRDIPRDSARGETLKEFFDLNGMVRD